MHTLLKKILLILVITLSLCSISSANRKPNIIIILTDDQGSIDAGCYGAKDLETPNIDKIAERGIRFTQFYAAAPVCSP